MAAQPNQGASAPGAAVLPRSARLWAWVHEVQRAVADAWRRAHVVPAERWHGGAPQPRRTGLVGYVAGLSSLYQRLRWDVALRRSVITASWLLLVGLPVPWSIVAALMFLWFLMPR